MSAGDFVDTLWNMFDRRLEVAREIIGAVAELFDEVGSEKRDNLLRAWQDLRAEVRSPTSISSLLGLDRGIARLTVDEGSTRLANSIPLAHSDRAHSRWDPLGSAATRDPASAHCVERSIAARSRHLVARRTRRALLHATPRHRSANTTRAVPGVERRQYDGGWREGRSGDGESRRRRRREARDAVVRFVRLCLYLHLVVVPRRKIGILVLIGESKRRFLRDTIDGPLCRTLVAYDLVLRVVIDVGLGVEVERDGNGTRVSFVADVVD